ncbi:class I SAM-dependent methyltransferase [Streptosporangium nondiastaticum]|uniref:class I SAM-dependent methyltransferase n=1 Tax=Streptosporangium nondiastaticum TaxID=35764 RepID=UPI0031F87908
MDESKLRRLLERVTGDMGAAFGAATVMLGDRLGLWKALAGAGPLTPEELAGRTGTDPRLIAEWLAAQAAAGYVDYADGVYTLTDEQAAVFADDSSPAFMVGFAEVIGSVHRDEAKVARAYRGEEPLGWGDHDPALFRGAERSFRSGYAANLTVRWIPALDGVEARLLAGARVADVGCGHGTSTLVMAAAYPESRFTGFDQHGESIARARGLAEREGLAGRVRFERADASAYPGNGYDLVCLFDCLHDMGDPVGALRHVRATLAGDGTVLLVEPFATGRLPDDFTPVGRVFRNASATVCVPSAISQGGTEVLGAQAGPERLLSVARRAGFTRAREAAATPINLVLELRP